MLLRGHRHNRDSDQGLCPIITALTTACMIGNHRLDAGVHAQHSDNQAEVTELQRHVIIAVLTLLRFICGEKSNTVFMFIS